MRSTMASAAARPAATRSWRAVLVGPVRRVHREAAGADPHPHQAEEPRQNGVRERAFGSLNYEHLYRLEIDDGHQLGLEVAAYRELFNQIRPHQSLAGRRPLDVHLKSCKTRQTL